MNDRKEFNVSKYERENFEGIDTDLNISLNEYGLIWKEYKRASKKKRFIKGEYLFIFINSSGELDWSGNIHKSTDLLSEFNWVKWNDILKFVGSNEEEYFKNSVPSIIFDLVSYYGVENVFH